MQNIPVAPIIVIAAILIVAALILPISNDWRLFLGFLSAATVFLLLGGRIGLDSSLAPVGNPVLFVAFGCYIAALVYLARALAP